MAGYCKEYLEENYENVRVLLTRDEDECPGLLDRVEYARDMGADFFLSIHLNATESGNATGAYALVPRGRYRPEQGQASQDVATAILNRLEDLGVQDRGFLIKTTSSNCYPDGSYWDAYDIVRYCVNRNIPGIIMEECFIDNYSDYQHFLSSEQKLQSMGEANALGLAQELDLVLKDEPTDPEPTDPEPTDPEPTDPEPTDPDPTDPDPTEPEPTDPEPAALPFVDVLPGQWFYDAVAYVYEKGLMNGITETVFAPDDVANRAMAVTLLYRMDGSGEQADTITFTDVSPERWYYHSIEWAVAAGITKGVSETEFAPGEPVTREQFVTFLWRYAQMLGYEVSAQAPEDFTDAGEIGQFAREAMGWAVDSGILTGYSDGTVKPKRALSRAELATMIWRFDQYLLGGSQQEPPVEEPPVEEVDVWTISHEDVTIKVGESFRLRVRNQDGEVADVTWEASKSGYVTIDGNKITGAAKGTVTVRCQWEGQTFSCIVRVKNA